MAGGVDGVADERELVPRRGDLLRDGVSAGGDHAAGAAHRGARGAQRRRGAVVLLLVEGDPRRAERGLRGPRVGGGALSDALRSVAVLRRRRPVVPLRRRRVRDGLRLRHHPRRPRAVEPRRFKDGPHLHVALGVHLGLRRPPAPREARPRGLQVPQRHRLGHQGPRRPLLRPEPGSSGEGHPRVERLLLRRPRQPPRLLPRHGPRLRRPPPHRLRRDLPPPHRVVLLLRRRRIIIGAADQRRGEEQQQRETKEGRRTLQEVGLIGRRPRPLRRCEEEEENNSPLLLPLLRRSPQQE
mmetsp:Transcript_14883/g.48547  ORF Transcript_14883/g.48547 Transcript_14883/m.48547 type:complete len:297 (+) Transcript_14883:223-1113(+)